MTTPNVETPQGYRAAACSAGIKKSGKLDLALIVSDTPAQCAGVFTTNKVVAAPVQVTAPRIREGVCQAILVNSGNANACTGEAGVRDSLESARLVAEALDIPEDVVAVSSTGVIGVPLPIIFLQDHVPRLCAALSNDQFAAVAQAMRTTDAFPKMSSRTFPVDGAPCRILGIAKGAGMIHPDMATMLAFIMTDAQISAGLLEHALQQAVEHSFNRITVDRDTSTNDMVLLLANGAAGSQPVRTGSSEAERFTAALQEVMLDLAKLIAKDGEGATKLVRIAVTGARDDDQALLAARAIATSLLVKTAFFGEDPNWGRIIAAAGYSGADLDVERVAIRFNDVVMVENGLGLGPEQEALAAEVMRLEEFTVTVDLGVGDGAAFYYTSDLGHDYVKINADYRT